MKCDKLGGIVSATGTPIFSLLDWQTHAPPKRAIHWADDRSAKEAARAWLAGGGTVLPTEISAALETNSAFDTIQSWRAVPEARLRFDTLAGEPRNSDLAVYAHDAHGPFLMAVEAKADESFGRTVSEVRAEAIRRAQTNLRSGGIRRIDQLLQAILIPASLGATRNDDIRYQLLTATAGALCEAERQGHTRALMLVQEFITDRTRDSLHQRNGADVNKFVDRVSGGQFTCLRAGEVLGPFSVPGLPLVTKQVQLFLGKVSTNLRGRKTACLS